MTSTWEMYGTATVRFWLDDHVLELTPAAPGVRTGATPFGDVTLHVITGFNPGGRMAAAAVNARAQTALVAELDALGLTWRPAVGGDFTAGHAEDSVAVAGLDDRKARAIGRRYGQDAIFAWTPDAWHLLSCQDGRTATSGWTTRTCCDGGRWDRRW
ncbi:DUF3293 domain-containing protein [Sphaerisporangium perillae]|uniref:DUF3293 domain-containing protein n=1 Tax=Sphaerisporangium perillae TaxID=2935860 RepID=UPI00200CC0D6|nr:DUF3293 domain-containing protein [Sphaerisporangium perillae]